MKKIISSNFIFNTINSNLKKLNFKCNTRFAPQANFYLHIGHVKNIIINFDISKIYNGKFKIRIDDTNPDKNKKKFIKSIKNDLNFIINKKKYNKINKIYYTSNYFNKIYQYLEYYKKKNIKINKLFLIRKTKSGYFKEKKKVIKIKKYNKIIYRIKFKKHIKTKHNWFVYPMYDWSQCLADKIENISYSICSIEFSKNKKYYMSFSKIIYKNNIPRQIESSRLTIKNNITKKRILYFLLKKKYIKNSKDLRLLTIKSLKKQGINKNIIYLFIKELNLSRNLTIINDKIFKKKILSYINIEYNYNAIENYIIIILKNKFIIKYKTKNNIHYISNKILLNIKIFIKCIFKKIFFLKFFKKNIFLNIHLNNIVCYNYKKNNIGYIIYMYCKFKKKKKIFFENKFLNYKYKNKILFFLKKELIINKKNIFNFKSIKIKKYYLENLIINKIFGFNKINNKNYIFFKKFNKNNKIIFLLLY